MILQALNDLYNRLKDDPDYGVPVPGFSVQKISFRIVLKPDGSLLNIEDARSPHTRVSKSGTPKTTFVSTQMLVPGGTKPPGQGINPCTLWDSTAYLLGYGKPDKDPDKAEKDKARALKCLAATKEHYNTLAEELPLPEIVAIQRFYTEHWDEGSVDEWIERLEEFGTGFGIFRVLPQDLDVHQIPEVRNWWLLKNQHREVEAVTGMCLVTGNQGAIARIAEPAIKGVKDAQSGGAKLASFNQTSFESYAKEQTYNSPVSEEATFAYCNALNALLVGPKCLRHRIHISSTTVVFWTQTKTLTESLFSKLLYGYELESEKKTETESEEFEEDQATHLQIEAFLQVLRRGGGSNIIEIGENPDTRFFTLGLSGNVTRLAVRFWHVDTISSLTWKLAEHFKAISLHRRPDAHPFHEPEFPTISRLLEETVRDKDSIPPLLPGQLLYAILEGTPYPIQLLSAVLVRLKARDDLTYLKAGLIKAVLMRNFKQTIDMSLNTDRKEPAYLLGRLFATLEKTQNDALGNINAGIRERFYSSASATPRSVFPRLLRNYQHHLAKLEGGHRLNRERLVQNIHESLTAYPSHLNLEEQGLFAIGYYHQRQDFFTKKEPEAIQI